MHVPAVTQPRLLPLQVLRTMHLYECKACGYRIAGKDGKPKRCQHCNGSGANFEEMA